MTNKIVIERIVTGGSEGEDEGVRYVVTPVPLRSRRREIENVTFTPLDRRKRSLMHRVDGSGQGKENLARLLGVRSGNTPVRCTDYVAALTEMVSMCTNRGNNGLTLDGLTLDASSLPDRERSLANSLLELYVRAESRRYGQHPSP